MEEARAPKYSNRRQLTAAHHHDQTPKSALSTARHLTIHLRIAKIPQLYAGRMRQEIHVRHEPVNAVRCRGHSSIVPNPERWVAQHLLL